MDIPPAQPPAPDGPGEPGATPPVPRPWDAAATQVDAAALAPAEATPPAGARPPAGASPLPPPAPDAFAAPPQPYPQPCAKPAGEPYAQPYPQAFPPPTDPFAPPPSDPFAPPGAAQAYPPPYAGMPGPAGPPYGPPYGPPPYGANPYGMAGGPQGYWNGGYYQQPTSTNGLAIAALVVAVALTCLPLVGVFMGIMALRQIRRTGQGGRGLAIAAIAVNGVGTVFAAIVITIAAFGAGTGGTDVQDLRPGQCFNTVDSPLSDYSGAGRSVHSVDVVECRDDHDAEVFARFDLDPSDYPDMNGDLTRMASEHCFHLVPGYVGDDDPPAGMTVYYYLPGHDAWARGDHSVTCFLGSSDGPVSGSVAGFHHSSGVGV